MQSASALAFVRTHELKQNWEKRAASQEKLSALVTSSASLHEELLRKHIQSYRGADRYSHETFIEATAGS